MEAKLWTKEEILELIRAELDVRNARIIFKKPSIDDVCQYFVEQSIINPTENANKFWNYYEAKGWKIGKATMKDWKACVKTWKFDKAKPVISGYNFVYVSELTKADAVGNDMLLFMHDYLRISIDILKYNNSADELFSEWYLALDNLINKGYSIEFMRKIANISFYDQFWRTKIYNLPLFCKHFEKLKVLIDVV